MPVVAPLEDIAVASETSSSEPSLRDGASHTKDDAHMPFGNDKHTHSPNARPVVALQTSTEDLEKKDVLLIESSVINTSIFSCWPCRCMETAAPREDAS